MAVIIIALLSVLIVVISVGIAWFIRRRKGIHLPVQDLSAEPVYDQGVIYFVGEVARFALQPTWLVVDGVPTRLTRLARHRILVEQMVGENDWPLQPDRRVTLLVTLVDPILPLQTYKVSTTTTSFGHVLAVMNMVGEVLFPATGYLYEGGDLTSAGLRVLADRYVKAWDTSPK